LQELDFFWKAASELLKALTKVLEATAKRLEDMAEAGREEEALAKPKKKEATVKAVKEEAPAEEKTVTATETVLHLIERNPEGVDTARLKEKTGFNEKKIRGIVFNLRKQGKIKSKRRGVYVKREAV
jgi:hypothetical protein